MQINGIQNYNNSNQNFTGEIVSTYALRKFKAGLSKIDADKFEKYVENISNINDGKKFVFEPVLAGNFKCSKIHRLDCEGKMVNPPLLYEDKGNPLDLFRQLSDWYKTVKF